MNERVIFDAALEIADAEARLAFIEKACVGNPAMLEAVKSLLKSHDAAGSFLDMPVREQIGQANPEDSAAATEKTRLYRPGNASPDDSGDDIDDDSQPDLSFLQTSSKPGSIGVLAHYEVLSVLGQGAFGIVFKAFDEKLHRLVAIKVMNPQLAATSPPRKRFLREARAAAAIRHENVVQVYSVEEQPLPYLVMEFIDGQTLKDKLDGAGPLETSEVLHIGRQIANGLAAAQTMGLIHRDIKPANILLEKGAEQRVKISDFGLARAADDASLTQSGTIAGTPMYMAPEQATGQALDHRADLFSFGSVLYQMACGRPPFRASNTVAVLRRVVEDTPRPLQEILPEIPDWLVAIVTKLHAKKPEDRFQTAKEVADLLARCQSELQLNGKVTCVAIPNVGHVSNVPAPQPVEPNTVTKSIEPAPISEHVENVLHEKRRRPFLIAATVIGIAVLASVMIKPWHKDGTVTELSKPQISNSSSSANPQPPTPNPSSWHGWPADAPKPAIAPFDAAQAKKHQEEWAAYLKVPVEYTNSLGMKFRLIPPGEFLMGSTADETEAALKGIDEGKHWQECVKSEMPQHKVILTQSIYLGVNEVTQAEYVKVMGTNPSHFASTGEGKEAVAGLNTTTHPVEMVSWNDAADFCANLCQQEQFKPFYFRSGETIVRLDGTGYRLPTEAEWEFACRAGTTTKYWIGDKDEDLVQAAWFGGNSGGRTHTAGELRANPYGLSGMHGNVWEWVEDEWEPTFYGQFQQKPAINPNIPFSVGIQRGLRGGDWSHHASFCRSSARYANASATRRYELGFRISLPVEAVRQALKVAWPALPRSVATTPSVPAGAQAVWHGWSADAPPPAIAPFDAEQAKQHQAAWAKYLGVPVEYTNSLGMKFRLIPPGEFLMGSTPEEIAAALKDVGADNPWQEMIKSEAPQHKVILTQPIYLGVNEVTQAEYEKVMGANPSHFAPMGMGKEAVANLQTGSHPVEMVSWNDAAEFCAKLSQQEKLKPFYFRAGETVTPLDGTGYRLPTEAEWEFACRAGTTTKFWIGDTDHDMMKAGWFFGNSGGRTHAAGELKANPFGLFDIHGNVWEMVQDGRDAAFYGNYGEKPAINPSSPFSSAGSQRVLRGGFWNLAASSCRSSFRNAGGPTHRRNHVGFRVALPVDAARQTLKVTGPALPKPVATTPSAPASN